MASCKTRRNTSTFLKRSNMVCKMMSCDLLYNKYKCLVNVVYELKYSTFHFLFLLDLFILGLYWNSHTGPLSQNRSVCRASYHIEALSAHWCFMFDILWTSSFAWSTAGKSVEFRRRLGALMLVLSACWPVIALLLRPHYVIPADVVVLTKRRLNYNLKSVVIVRWLYQLTHTHPLKTLSSYDLFTLFLH